MIEFTMGGAWFRWNALDRRGKWLAGLSIMAAVLAGIPLYFMIFNVGLVLGYEIGSGTSAPPNLAPRSFTPFMAWWAISLGVTSAVLWWRFSQQQDEMFNRVQNWALGSASSWTIAVATIWAILSFAGALPPVSIGAILLVYFAALTGFWFVAVRRWA